MTKNIAEKEGVLIRRETEGDYRAVEHLVRESFWNVYRPGCYEHFVLHRLRNDRRAADYADYGSGSVRVALVLAARCKTSDCRGYPVNDEREYNDKNY